MAQMLRAFSARGLPSATAQSIAAIAPFFVAPCSPMSKTGAQRCARIDFNCHVDALLSTWVLKAAALQS
ncbi:hypothetical protein XarbCFBP8152_15990 [Xanthomonas arboricola]|nr:hypothetical protein XarbCFBP8152_15990 [Xanthomonas arboricola]